jgi:hypothetical protein
MVVSLHACDTATDDALAQAIGWNARVILAVPCCQHELFKKLADDTPLRPLTRHGLLRERLSALVTDGLRAQLLEVCGYQVQTLEFIQAEHTPKNLLLRAVRRSDDFPAAHRDRLAREYQALRDFWRIEPYFERLLQRVMPVYWRCLR